jgi:hypothetical protein
VGTKGDGSKAEDGDLLTEPHIVADDQSPRKGNVDAGTDNDASADASTKQAEDKNAKGGWPGKGVEKEEAFTKNPKSFLDASGTAIKGRIVVEV